MDSGARDRFCVSGAPICRGYAGGEATHLHGMLIVAGNASGLPEGSPLVVIIVVR